MLVTKRLVATSRTWWRSTGTERSFRQLPTQSFMRSRESSVDSLFDEEDGGVLDTGMGSDAAQEHALVGEDDVPAQRIPPMIPGLYLFPGLLAPEVTRSALRSISAADHFLGGQKDQVMLFTAAPPSPNSLPTHVRDLDDLLASSLASLLPPEVSRLAFSQPLARQAILNLYPPGTGIAPHIDLPNRYADGIVGVSLIGGCVMTFRRGDEQHDVYLPPRSVYVLSGEARWDWTHGIAYRYQDIVSDHDRVVTLPRALRVSVTFRWMSDAAGLLA